MRPLFEFAVRHRAVLIVLALIALQALVWRELHLLRADLVDYRQCGIYQDVPCYVRQGRP